MSGDAAPGPGGGAARSGHPRLLVLGANGPTGRQTVRQALARGHRVVALTRHPQSFPIEHERLVVIAGDATDPAVIDAAVAAVDAVICAIGTRFTLGPVDVYSTSARLVTASMRRHGRDRLVVVTSAGVRRSRHRRSLTQTALYSFMRRGLGRTLYDDMARMESLVSSSGLDWTIVHPPGLVSVPGRGYVIDTDEIEGPLCSREDLARMLLDQLGETRYHRTIAAVATPGLRVSAAHMIRREVLKR